MSVQPFPLEKWKPRPNARYNSEQRAAYHAGYSDSWYGYPYGAGVEQPSAAYAKGWHDVKESLEA